MRLNDKRCYVIAGLMGIALVSPLFSATEKNLIETSPGFEEDATVNPLRPPLGWRWQIRGGGAANQEILTAEGYQSKTALRLKKTDSKTTAFQRICHPLPHVVLEAGATYRLEFAYRCAEAPSSEAGVSIGISSTGGADSASNGADDFLPGASVVFESKSLAKTSEWKIKAIEFVPNRKTVSPYVLISQNYWADSPYDLSLDNFQLTKIAEAPKVAATINTFNILSPKGEASRWEVSEVTNSSWDVSVESQKTSGEPEVVMICRKDFGQGYFHIKTNFPSATNFSNWAELGGQFSAQWDSEQSPQPASPPVMNLWGIWLNDVDGKSVLHVPWVTGRLSKGENLFTALLNYPYPLWNQNPKLDQIASITLRFNLPLEAGKFSIRLKSAQARSINSDLGDGQLQADFLERRKQWFTNHPANCSGFHLGAASVHRKYGPAYLPESEPENPRNVIQFATAANGHAMSQLLAFPSPTASATDLTWAIGELTHETTKKPLAVPWSLARVTYTPILPREFEPVLAGKYPDPFCHDSTIHLNPQTTHALWLSGKIPAGTPSGIYRGQLKLKPSASDKPLLLPIELQVWGFDLPAENNVKTNFWISRAPIMKWEQKWKLSFAEYSPYLDMVLDHRLSPIDVDPEFSVWREKDGKYTIDLSAWQEYVEYCNKKNPGAFNSLNLGPNHFFITFLQKGFKVLDRETKQEVHYDNSPFSKINQELFALYIHTAEHWLKQKGWLNKAYIQPCDEPHTDDTIPDLKRCMELIKEVKGESPILLTVPVVDFNEKHYDVLKLADLWVPSLPGMPQKYIRDQRKLGHSIWGYVCTGGSPLIGGETLSINRWFWTETWRRKLDGFLYWGVNWWGEDFDSAWGKEGAWSGYRKGTNGSEALGDGVLLYPGPSSSLRLEALLLGIEDYHYLWLLSEAYVKRKKLANPPSDLLQSAEDLMAVEDLQKKIDRDPQACDRFRAQVAELIAKLQATP